MRFRSSTLQLAYGMSCGLLATYVMPYEIGAYIEGYGYDPSRAGMLGMLELGSVAATTAVLAPFVARWSLARLLIIGAVVAATAQFICVVASTFPQLFMARMMAGVGSGCVLAVINATIAADPEPEREYGRVYAGVNLLFAGMLWLLPHIARSSEPAHLFMVLALMQLLLVPIAAVLPWKVAATTTTASGNNAKYLWNGAGALFAASTLAYIAQGGTYSFSERVAHNIGIAPNTYGAVLAASTIMGIFGASMSGWLGSRYGWSRPLVGGLIVTGLSTLTIVCASTEGVYAAGLIAYGGLYMFTISYIQGAAATIDRTGRLAVAIQGFLLAMFALGPYIFGMALSTTSHNLIGVATALMCALAGLIVWPLARGLSVSKAY